MIVAGIGFRSGTTSQEIDAALAAALESGGIAGEALTVMATMAGKGLEAGSIKAAASRGVPLVMVALADLEAVADRTVTKSERVQELLGIPSVAECAALAAGGPSAHIVVPRIAVGPATCALARIGDAP